MVKKTEKGFSEIAVRLANQCAGLSLIDADRVLDDARRYLWMRRFSGISKEALMRELASPHLETALRIGGELDGAVTPFEAEAIFTEARLYLWMETFAEVPGSLFSEQLRAYLEMRDGRTVQ